jgi:hypothetical protein
MAISVDGTIAIASRSSPSETRQRRSPPSFTHSDLVILDEFGYLPFSASGKALLFLRRQPQDDLAVALARPAKGPLGRGQPHCVLNLPAFLSPSVAAMITHAPYRLARRAGRRFMRRRMAVTIAAALFAVVAAPALAQNSESAPAAAAPMKSKP